MAAKCEMTYSVYPEDAKEIQNLIHHRFYSNNISAVTRLCIHRLWWRALMTSKVKGDYALYKGNLRCRKKCCPDKKLSVKMHAVLFSVDCEKLYKLTRHLDTSISDVLRFVFWCAIKEQWGLDNASDDGLIHSSYPQEERKNET